MHKLKKQNRKLTGMSRLPIPGSDSGQWGDILNDYLSQAHQADGTLKPITESNITGLTSDLSSKESVANKDTDGTLAANSDTKYPSQKAVKTYVDASILGSGSGITRIVTTTSGSYTAGSTLLVDRVYLIAGAHTTTLPAASGNSNRYTFKNNHSAAVTINRAGSDTIEGATSISIAPEDSVDLISNSTSTWYVI